MRVLVCGSRNFENWPWVHAELDKLEGVGTIIEGGATGVDRIAQEWGIRKGWTIETYAANWVKHGKAGGPIRNKQMLDEGKPDLVIAFPGGKGTANMVKQAREAGVKVVEIK